MKHLKRYTESLKTPCQTPDVNYNIEIGDKVINCQIELPFELDLDEKEAKLLEYNIHNSMEIILSKYFNK
jgi:hypothetical protein